MLLDGNVTELPKNRGCVCGWAISRTMLAHECFPRLFAFKLIEKMCPFLETRYLGFFNEFALDNKHFL